MASTNRSRNAAQLLDDIVPGWAAALLPLMSNTLYPTTEYDALLEEIEHRLPIKET